MLAALSSLSHIFFWWNSYTTPPSFKEAVLGRCLPRRGHWRDQRWGAHQLTQSLDHPGGL